MPTSREYLVLALTKITGMSTLVYLLFDQLLKMFAPKRRLRRAAFRPLKLIEPSNSNVLKHS